MKKTPDVATTTDFSGTDAECQAVAAKLKQAAADSQ
jgi:hypothetical protein